MIDTGLNQKIVVVIGGAQGIGRAVRNAFLAQGATVIDADLQYSTPFEKATDGAIQTSLNLADESSVKSFVSDLEQKDLIPDVLVHVAGISIMDFFLESKSSDFDKIYEVNVKGAYVVLREIVSLMKQADKKGRVITIASQAGKNPYRGLSAYVSSKHALIGLTKNLALEVAKDGILVNTVCPGIIETEMKHRERVDGGLLRGMTAEEIAEEDASQVPLGRTGSPEEVANVVLFLASPLASYLTGQAINVTGGMTMH